jgi:hypothetical protein
MTLYRWRLHASDSHSVAERCDRSGGLRTLVNRHIRFAVIVHDGHVTATSLIHRPISAVDNDQYVRWDLSRLRRTGAVAQPNIDGVGGVGACAAAAGGPR